MYDLGAKLNNWPKSSLQPEFGSGRRLRDLLNFEILYFASVLQVQSAPSLLYLWRQGGNAPASLNVGNKVITAFAQPSLRKLTPFCQLQHLYIYLST